LEKVSPARAELVKLRFFVGLTVSLLSFPMGREARWQVRNPSLVSVQAP